VARRIPEHRFDDLVDQATEVFIARGYRLTQMADVAEAVGVAKGTLYGYVESKEALFALCLRWADRRGPVERPEVLPFPTPPPGAVAARTKQRLAQAGVPPLLAEALERERAEDPAAELEALVREYYELISRHHRSIKLMDRCTDHPELGPIWQAEGREGPRLALARYVAQRVRAGQFRPVVSVRLAARMIVEIVATWAIHIHWDRAPEAFDPDQARENAVAFLVRGLIPDAS
jgi:AcrR family transcriptional regulator